jgi:hypothetical protein
VAVGEAVMDEVVTDEVVIVWDYTKKNNPQGKIPEGYFCHRREPLTKNRGFSEVFDTRRAPPLS